MNKGLFTSEAKVGLFVAFIIIILIYSTVRVSQTSLSSFSSYSVFLEIDSASGIAKKTPVQIAGIEVGEVESIKLLGHNRARIELSINDDVKLDQNVKALVKSVGFLGDTYIELYQPGSFNHELKDGAIIKDVFSYGDINSLTGQLTSISEDVKAITSTLKVMMAGEDSSFANSLRNVEQITGTLSRVSVKNEENMGAIIENLRALSENLNAMVAQNGSARGTADNMYSITDKINRGEGTIGRLINDESTIDKINESVDNINDMLGSANKMKVDIGYHTEYLGNSEEFKHYVSLALRPKPDKAFLFEFVDDPAPDTKVTQTTRTITSNGTTTVVNEEVETTDSDKFVFSAQLAKSFYDFTFRGGIIESSGGVGVDFNRGSIGLGFSAFDFETKRGERPHLKAWGKVNLTQSFFVLGGYDDFINTKEGRDWFMGAGITIQDDDIKSLFGLMSLKK